MEDEFSKLPMRTQTLATQISQMGFQRELVIRAVSRIGENDKKVVEHLIPLSELLQMGFEEEQVSEALIKFDNNKDRALDYLIS
jgi:ubiquitin-associated protein 1